MTRSITFLPAAGSSGAYCYTERASGARGLYLLVQELAPRAAPSRRGFVGAAYREIVARYQSAAHPETAASFLRGVVRDLDATARQVDTRVDDFRGLGLFVLVREENRCFLLCGRDVPARIRTGGVVLPVTAGAAGAVEVSIETVRAQQDLFSQSLTDSLALYRFDLVPGAPGIEFFLGGGAQDAAAVLDALQVERAPGSRVALERCVNPVLHVTAGAAPGRRAAVEPEHAHARAKGGTGRRIVLAAAGVAALAAALVWMREGPSGSRPAERAARATQERAEPRDVRKEPAASTEVAVRPPEDAGRAATRGFVEVWQRSYRDAVTSSPAAIGEAVVFGARDGNVYALAAQSGEVVWVHRAADGVGASPVAAGDAVIACDYAGNVYRLGRRDGAVAWKRALRERIVSTPVVTGERVVVGTVRGYVYALSLDTGRVLWKFRARAQIRGSLAAGPGVVVVPSHDGNVYALDESTGARRWAAAMGGAVSSSPAVDGGRVFVGTARGAVAALDVGTGRPVWSFATGAAVNSSVRVAGGRVYAGSGDRNLYCLNAADGALVWKHATSGAILSRVAIDDGRVVVTSYDGAVYCLDAATGRLQGRFDSSESIYSSPLVLGGRVYFGNNDGRFYGLDLPR
jgi:outer membrane protein assembly factor BamB